MMLAVGNLCWWMGGEAYYGLYSFAELDTAVKILEKILLSRLLPEINP
jgi:hypothetical protein